MKPMELSVAYFWAGKHRILILALLYLLIIGVDGGWLSDQYKLTPPSGSKQDVGSRQLNLILAEVQAWDK